MPEETTTSLPIAAPSEAPVYEDIAIPSQFYEARATVYSKSGTQIYLTSHAPYIDAALDGIVECVKYGVEKHGWAITASHPPAHAPAAAPAPAPAPGTATTPLPASQPAPAVPQVIKVDTVSTDFTTAGELFLRCKGAQFQKFGLSAYKEVISPELYAQMATWPAKKEFVPPAGLEYVRHDGKKVLSFQNTNTP